MKEYQSRYQILRRESVDVNNAFYTISEESKERFFHTCNGNVTSQILKEADCVGFSEKKLTKLIEHEIEEMEIPSDSCIALRTKIVGYQIVSLEKHKISSEITPTYKKMWAIKSNSNNTKAYVSSEQEADKMIKDIYTKSNQIYYANLVMIEELTSYIKLSYKDNIISYLKMTDDNRKMVVEKCKADRSYSYQIIEKGYCPKEKIYYTTHYKRKKELPQAKEGEIIRPIYEFLFIGPINVPS